MLGQFGPVTAEIARSQALRMLGQVKGAGADPAADGDRERAAASVAELGKRFLKEHAAVRCKPRTLGEYTRCVDLFITPFFKSQKARSVTTADVAEFQTRLAHIPYQANRAMGVLSKMMSLAETWGIRDRRSNPCEDVKRFPERKRERFLSSDELKALGKALDDYEQINTESFYAVAAFRLLVLTGCRLSEIQTLQWKFVHLAEAELRLPDSKTGAKTVHVGEAAVTALRAIPKFGHTPVCDRRQACRRPPDGPSTRLAQGPHHSRAGQRSYPRSATHLRLGRPHGRRGTADDRKASGAATFRVTRLLVAPIADLMHGGATIADPQEDFPRLTPEMAEAALVFTRLDAA
jgi:integrase